MDDLQDVEIGIIQEQKNNMPSPLRRRAQIENEKFRDEWRGCCSRTNKHFLKYLTQIIMGSSVMIFCMVQIIRGSPNPEIYFSLLSGTLGLFLPHPQIKDDD